MPQDQVAEQGLPESVEMAELAIRLRDVPQSTGASRGAEMTRLELWEILCAADDKNFLRLIVGFPAQANAVHDWKYGDLGKRLRKAGLDI